MGFFSDLFGGNDGGEEHVVKETGKPAWEQRTHRMHGTSAEWKLMSGKGALIKWNGERVPLNDKPGNNHRRP